MTEKLLSMQTTDPQSEIFDVVDEQNRVVGVASRAEVHRLGLRHRACHIVVFDRQSQVLVQQRSLTKDSSPGLWDSSAAGHVDSGETYIACAVRELSEELGVVIDAKELQECFLLSPEPYNGMEFAMVYTIETDQVIRPDEVEVAAVRWLATAELEAWIAGSPGEFTEVFRVIWNRLSSLAT